VGEDPGVRDHQGAVGRIAGIADIARHPTPAAQKRRDLGTPVIAEIGKAKEEGATLPQRLHLPNYQITQLPNF
jgi:hypothetical protein